MPVDSLPKNVKENPENGKSQGPNMSTKSTNSFDVNLALNPHHSLSYVKIIFYATWSSDRLIGPLGDVSDKISHFATKFENYGTKL